MTETTRYADMPTEDMLTAEIDHQMQRAESAEADAKRLAEALEALGAGDLDAADAGGWHLIDCEVRYSGFCECDETCTAAREALRLHKEQVDG